MNTYTWEYKEIPNKFDGWQTEVVKTLYTVILKALNDLIIDYPGLTDMNWRIEADAATVALLQQLPNFIMNDKVDYDPNTQIVGKLGAFTVVRNIKQIENTIWVSICGVNDKNNYIFMAKIDVKGLEKFGS